MQYNYMPRAYPTKASFTTATLYVGNGQRAKYRRIKGRSFLASCKAAGLGKLATRKALAAAWQAQLLGQPISWPA